MKKAFINNLNGDEKMAATEYVIEVHHKSDEVIELSCVQYSYEDVFEYIKEYYEDKNDESVDKVIIKVKK